MIDLSDRRYYAERTGAIDPNIKFFEARYYFSSIYEEFEKHFYFNEKDMGFYIFSKTNL